MGCIFIYKFSPPPVAAISQLIVHPNAEADEIDKLLMDTALSKAWEQKLERIKLVQSPSL